MSAGGDFPTQGHTHAVGHAEMAARRHGANPSSHGPGSEGRTGAIAFWIALVAIVLAVGALLVAIDGREATPDSHLGPVAPSGETSATP